MGWEDEDWDEPAPQAVVEDEKPTFSDEDEEAVSEDEHKIEGSKPKNPDAKPKIKKKSKKELEKEKEALRKIEEEAALNAKAMSADEIMAEKLRQQKLVEQADNKLTEELFGLDSSQGVKKAAGIYDEDTCAAILQTLPLDTDEQFKILAASLGKRLEMEQKQIATTEFLKDLIRKVSVILPYEDLVDIDSVLSVIKNTKVKTKLNKKKKKAGKKFANVQRTELDEIQDKAGDGGYDKYDDFDFM